MGHEIRENDRFGEVRSEGKRAWHKLGLEIPVGLTAEEAFPRIGLGWETELWPLFAVPTAEQARGVESRGGKVEVVPCKDSLAHVRLDDQSVLGIVSSDYKPFSNADLARFADALPGADATVRVETAGSLYGGRRVFVLVKLPKSIQVTRQDVLESYVLLSNGHGGFASLSVYPTSVRVVCANTLRMSERDLGRGCRFRHTGDFASKVQMARQLLGLAVQETERFEQKVKALAGKFLTGFQLRNYLEATYDATFGTTEAGLAGLEDESRQKVLEKRRDVLAAWTRNMEDSTNTLPEIDGTAWAAYNAISGWHDHGRGRTAEGSDTRVHSNLFGVSQEHKALAFKAALSLV